MNVILIMLIIILAGCSVVQPKYTAPKEKISINKNVIKINKPFDKVWQSLIEYASQSFFAIKNFEKDSGLLTLSFGSSQPENYVDCGEIIAKHLKYDGPYLNIAETTGTVNLTGTMNLFVKSVDGDKTSVSVNTRYILNIKDGNLPRQTWNFDTNGKQSRKLGVVVITCVSTLVAENDIISGINLISQEN